jgi:hypothetical protein
VSTQAQGQEGLEPEMEEFLLRIVPGLAEQWQGSTPEEVARIEELACRPLPPFYRWFLSRMGQSMGPLAYTQIDFSARRVLTSYAEELVIPDSQLLLIGHTSDKMMPLHYFYDLDLPMRNDARVTRRFADDDDERHEQFETFREMLAYGALSNFRVKSMPQSCMVLLRGREPDTFSRLNPVMDSLGFTRPVPTGSCCGLYDRHDAAMVCSKTPGDESLTFMFAWLGGRDSATLRRVLGAIATESSLRTEVREWTPPVE